jgi:hypothetical protein
MKTFLIVSIAILFLGCKNPVSPSLDINVSTINGNTVENMSDMEFITNKPNPIDYSIFITNPSSSTETLTGSVVFVDSSKQGYFDCLTLDSFHDSTFSLPPGKSVEYIIGFYSPIINNKPVKGSFSIYHNVSNKPNPIVVKLNGQRL